jgi:FtsH-binding integral membrane protein
MQGKTGRQETERRPPAASALYGPSQTLFYYAAKHQQPVAKQATRIVIALGYILWVLGWVVWLAGTAMILVVARRQGPVCFLGCLFLPFVYWIFLVIRVRSTAGPFALALAGALMAGTGSELLDSMAAGQSLVEP